MEGFLCTETSSTIAGRQIATTDIIMCWRRWLALRPSETRAAVSASAALVFSVITCILVGCSCINEAYCCLGIDRSLTVEQGKLCKEIPSD
jgi:hypothetical protein